MSNYPYNHHCLVGLYRFMWFMIKVTFGEHDRCDKNAKPETRFVLRAISGDFSYLNFDNDIALLRLNDKVPITETIRPICLPKNPSKLNFIYKRDVYFSLKIDSMYIVQYIILQPFVTDLRLDCLNLMIING